MRSKSISSPGKVEVEATDMWGSIVGCWETDGVLLLSSVHGMVSQWEVSISTRYFVQTLPLMSGCVDCGHVSLQLLHELHS